MLYNIDGFIEKNRDFLPNNLFYVAKSSNNLLVQELFQCKLTRKGTLAPSDRQSKLRKSISINFYSTTDESNESDETKSSTNTKVQFSNSTITSSLSSMASYKSSINKLSHKIGKQY